MIVHGNANAKTGKKRRGRKKRKGARTQRKPGSQNLKEHFHRAFLPAIQSAILGAILCYPPSYFLLCAFASLRLCVFFLVFPAALRFLLLSVFVRWTRKKNQPSRGLGETADGCLLKDGSDRRVD
jgi:hypothetical protein